MTSLYKYQKHGVLAIERLNGRALLADDMGLGKTIQALYYLRRNKAITTPTLIISPAIAKWEWQEQAHKHTKLHITVGESFTAPKHFDPTQHTRIVINYEIALYWSRFIIRHMHPQCLILDEVHYLKSMDADRTEIIRKIGKNIPHIIAISGTPLLSRPIELYPTINLLWPKAFPDFLPYAIRHCHPKFVYGRLNFTGACKLPLLRAKLKRLGMIRRLTEDVQKQLPHIRRIVKLVHIDNMTEYREARDDFKTWLRKTKGQKKNREWKAERLVRNGYLRRLTAQGKLSTILEWVDSFLEENRGKLILFAHHHFMIDAILKKFSRCAVSVYGKTNAQEKHRIVKRFQTSTRIRIFVGSLAAKEVITLTAADTLAFVELWDVPGWHKQAEQRIRRIGQKSKHVLIYYFIAKGTVDVETAERLERKQNVVTKILDGERESQSLKIHTMYINKRRTQ